jgi:CDP-diacylglycerol--glycerol-3-phosphate 3-phosphatidyltransferase
MSKALEAVKQAVRRVMRHLAAALHAVTGGRLTPNTVTVIGLLAHVPIAWLIAMQHFYWAAAGLVVFGLFDTLDGELARLQKRESPSGALLDSITDRVKEVILYAAAAWAIIAQTGHAYFAVWAVVACGCALLTSYVNAAGDVAVHKLGRQHATNSAFRGGLFPFEIRMFVLLLGLLSNHLAPAIIAIAVGAGLTAAMRLLRIFKTLQANA